MYLTIAILVLLLWIFVKGQTKEPFLTVATELDHKRALKYALKKKCESSGYQWVELGDEFSYDCKHTKQTCLKDSIYPTPEGKFPQYYEWREPNSTDAQLMAERRSVSQDYREQQALSQNFGSSINLSKDQINSQYSGVCILGNEPFRKVCEDEKLQYDPSTGKCKTTEAYCISKGLPFCNGDCYNPPNSWLMEQILGTTLGRTLSAGTNAAAIGICKAANI